MKLRVIQWHDTKTYQIQKKTWWFGSWNRLDSGLFSLSELYKWDLRDNKFDTEEDVFAFLKRFATEGRMAWVTNEVSPVVIKPFDLKDLDKIIKERTNA